MTAKLSRFALCVDVRDDSCLMVYDDDLSALEIRAEFSGARIGNWYRRENNEYGDQIWEKVDEVLPTRVERTKFVKICLPIFCVPNCTVFGCKWRKAKADQKLNIELYSPRLKSAIKVNANVKQLVELGIREAEHCHTFLTFNFVHSASTVKPPQWSLNSVEDIQNPSGAFHDDVASILRPVIPPPFHCSATFGKPTEWGIVKSVVKDPNNDAFRLCSVLCFRDGIIAYGRILPLRENCWRAQENDTVGFCSIEVADLFEKPVRVAFNVLNWKHHNLHATSSELLEDNCSLLEFDSDSKFHLASTLPVGSREGSESGFDSFFDVQSNSTKALVLSEQNQHDIKEAIREVVKNDSGDKRRFLPTQQQLELRQHQQMQQQQPNATMDGICVFTHTKGDDIFLRLFDKHSQCFTGLQAVNKKKVPFPPGHSNPTTSNWFKITYRNKTPRIIEIKGLCPETELGFLPAHLKKQQTWDLNVSEKLRDTKAERVHIRREQYL